MKFRKLGVIALGMLFVLGTATGAFAANANAPIIPQEDYQGSEYFPSPLDSMSTGYDGDYNDNDIGNANETGKSIIDDSGESVGDVIKSEGMREADYTTVMNQRTHGQYQKNTNSCASCHQTHTGAAKDLLFKQGVYNTCAACHDGTLGFYNVFEASTAGTFGGTQAGNASIHMATGDYSIAMAPGGNDEFMNSLDLNEGNEDKAWTQVFDCASCHAPHGSYSDRLLHYNPNAMANTPVGGGGQKLENVTIVNSLTNVTGNYTVFRGTAAEITAAGIANTYQDLTNGDPTADLPNGETVAVLLRKVGDAWVRDMTPWLYGYSFDSEHNKLYYTNFTDDAGARITQDFEIVYGRAYAFGAGLANVTKANIAPVYVVKFQGTAVREDAQGTEYPYEIEMPLASNVWLNETDFGGIPIVTVNPDIYDEESKGAVGYGEAIGKYCGACHTDYLAGSVRDYDQDKDGVYDWEDTSIVDAEGNALTAGTGMFSTAYRHTTNNNRYTCLKCHFAHGTDVTVMKDANDATVTDVSSELVAGGMDATAAEAAAIAYLKDQNASSALKRYTNMAVCWKCHTDSKATQLKNNDFFWSADNEVHGGASGADTTDEYGW